MRHHACYLLGQAIQALDVYDHAAAEALLADVPLEDRAGVLRGREGLPVLGERGNDLHVFHEAVLGRRDPRVPTDVMRRIDAALPREQAHARWAANREDMKS